MAKRSNTTKDIGLLRQLHEGGQLRLRPEFQRNAVWPRAAKAYLIDTILEEKPMPLFFFERGNSAQLGKPTYAVVDGQQRLRAIFEFMENRFSLTESKNKAFRGKRYSDLTPTLQECIRNYDIAVQELSGYSEAEIRDIFVRMNKYVVKLSPQELRHARDKGAFFNFVEELAALEFWRANRIFTKGQVNRMRNSEFAAELAILLIEGPQDKKAAIDLYYWEFQAKFPYAKEVRGKINEYLSWIERALPRLRASRFRKPTDLYGLIGALHELSRAGKVPRRIDPASAGKALVAFEKLLQRKYPPRNAAAYLSAASRQTDNIAPREARIEIIRSIISGA